MLATLCLSSNGNVGSTSLLFQTAEALSNNPISVLSQTGYMDSSGFFHIVGEVANTSNETVRSVQITASIYDPYHVIMGTGSAYSDIGTLGPGERSAFHLLLTGVGQAGPIGTYQLSISSQPAFGEQKPAFLRLTIGRAYYSGSTYHVIGEVTNEGNSAANFVKISGAFYDYNHQVIGEGVEYPNNVGSISPGQTAPFDMMVQSVPNQQIMYALYNAQSNEYSMINNYNYYINNQPSSNLQAQTSSSLSTQSLPPTYLSSSSPSSPSVAATAIQGGEGVVQGHSLQQIQSTRDSFKNNDNKTLQVTSANVISVPGGITQSMTGQVKNTGKDTLRFLTITAQVLDSKYKVIGTVIAIGKNTNLAPGQQTSFSGLGSVSQGTNPVYFKLTYDWL
jgi:hypothetical protein